MIDRSHCMAIISALGSWLIAPFRYLFSKAYRHACDAKALLSDEQPSFTITLNDGVLVKFADWQFGLLASDVVITFFADAIDDSCYRVRVYLGRCIAPTDLMRDFLTAAADYTTSKDIIIAGCNGSRVVTLSAVIATSCGVSILAGGSTICKDVILTAIYRKDTNINQTVIPSLKE